MAQHGVAWHGTAGLARGQGTAQSSLGSAGLSQSLGWFCCAPVQARSGPQTHTQRCGQARLQMNSNALTAQDGSLLLRTGIRAGVGKGGLFCSAGRVWKASPCPCSCPGRRAGMTLLAEPGSSGLWVRGSPGRPHPKASAA